MLPDDQLHLLTAAVDGELTPAEDRRVRLLLATSAEARVLYARLQADSDRIHNLTPAAPPPGLHTRIMARLPKAAPQPVTTPAPVPQRPSCLKPWVPVAVAAALLLGVAGSSFWYFSRPNHENPHSADTQTANADGATKAVLPRETAPLPSMPRVADVMPDSNTVAVQPDAPVEPVGRDELPPPRPLNKDFNAFPPLPPVVFDVVRVRVPFLASASDLNREDVKLRLTDELGRNPAVRIDLFVKDAARGVELLRGAGKRSGLTVLADAVTQERMKRKQASAYAVYGESLSAAELRDLLAKLAADDGKAKEPVLDTVHVTAAQAADQKDLKDLLGVDPGLWKRPASPTTNATEPKPISAGTGDQLTRTLTGRPPKPGEKPAFLTTFTPAAFRTHPAMSKELKEYLARRGERNASAVPVLIVIRQAAGG